MNFHGTFTALVTPFAADGSVALDALSALVEWQIESGVEGLVPCGSTGEAATLSHEEHAEVIRHVVDVVDGRMPVIAGTGSNSTAEACELTVHAREAGADAALAISPYYNKPTQEGIYRHYREIAEKGGLPLVLYNVPGRTASRMEPETIARLSHVRGVAALKEAGGDLEKTAETIRESSAALALLSGDDSLTLPMLALGGCGVISTIANVAPREMGDLVRAFEAGDLARARELHYQLLPVMQALFIEANPIPVKTALHILDRIPDPTLRLPLTEMSKGNRDRLEAALATLPGA